MRSMAKEIVRRGDALEQAERERDEARAEAGRLREAVVWQVDRWRALLDFYQGDETVEVTPESARIAESRLSAALEKP